MYARLGFAVAAHLRPSILIVDEVLAVGDLAFQAKCIAHMHRLTESGTTVLFVSHNLLAVGDLCSRALVLERGRLTTDGTTDEAIKAYRRSFGDPSGSPSADAGLRVRINGAAAPPNLTLQSGAQLRIDVEPAEPHTGPELDVTLNLVIDRADGRSAIHLRSDLSETPLAVRPGRNVFSVAIDELPLAPGAYGLWLRLAGLSTATPVMFDSDRIHLMIAGDQRLDGLALPRHRFEQQVDRLTASPGVSR
jgi:hypothetical protein